MKSSVISPEKTLYWFRVTAFAEACSWAGLLVGMLFKRVLDVSEIGVQIFGPIHGVLFLAYLVSVALAAKTNGWTIRRWVWGLLASIPPLCTIWFERVVTRRQPELEPQPA